MLVVFSGISLIFQIICFGLLGLSLRALAKKEAERVRRLSGWLALALLCGVLALGSAEVLDTLEKYPQLSAGLLLLKLLSTVGPMALGGGAAVCVLWRAAGKMG